MVRLAVDTDLTAIAEVMHLLRERTLFAQTHFPQYAMETVDLVKWILSQMLDHRTAIFVNEVPGGIAGIVGVTYLDMTPPPHLTFLDEWCLWGETTKDVAKVWRAAKQWGKARGALFAKRSIVQGRHEDVTWEVL